MRISVTELDQWRLYCQYEHGWVDYAELRKRLSPDQKQEESEAMRYGTAFHAYLEDAVAGREVKEFNRDGIDFKLDFDRQLYLPEVREVKTELDLSVDGMPVTLVGKADAYDGWSVFDHKLVEQFDAEKYLDSLQWRAYLIMFDARRFTYNVFECDRDLAAFCRVRELHQLTMCRYPGMERDVLNYVQELARFFRDYMPERLTYGDEKRMNLL